MDKIIIDEAGFCDLLRLTVEKKFSDKPLFCTEACRSRENVDQIGAIAVSSEKIYVGRKTDAEEIEITEYEINKLSDVRLNKMIGSVSIEAVIGGITHEISRSKINDSLRFSETVKWIKALSEGNIDPASVRFEGRRSTCPKCGRPYRGRSSVCNACTEKGATFKRLFAIIKPQMKLISVTMLIFFIVTGLNLIVPQIQKNMIDNHINTPDPKSFSVEAFLWVVLSLAAVNLIVVLLTMLRSCLISSISKKTVSEMRSMLYHKIQALSLSSVSKLPTGDIMGRITGDTMEISGFLTNQLPRIAEQLLTFVSVGVIMFLYNPMLSLCVILPTPLVVFVFWATRKRTMLMYRSQWVAETEANTVLHDIFQGVRVVKVFGTEERETEKFDRSITKVRNISIRNECYWNKIMPYADFLLGIGNFVVLYFVGNRILEGNMSIGDLTMFSYYTSLIYAPLRFASHLPRMIQRAAMSASKIFEILDEEIEVGDSETAIEMAIEGNVSFENVWFGYNEYEDVLKGVTFDVKPGEMLGIVGRSGVGKSTVINLMMRLYDPRYGKISVDGIDLKDLSQHSLRTQIGAVLQETYLFSGTIYDNIRYARPDSTDEEIINAAKLANAHSFIMKLPDAYNTFVGEKGYTLSGGERQRIAIARAVLCDPKILILDEATASLDTETEALIQDALQKLCKNRTTIAIAHRLSTLRNATRIIVLDKGKVAESGSHEELMSIKYGIYYNLVLAQRQMSRIENKNPKHELKEEKI